MFTPLAFNQESIVTRGLVFAVDAADRTSYSSGSGVWRDLSGGGNNGTLTNGPTFDSEERGSIIFDGTNDYVNFGNINLSSTIAISISFWCKILSYPEISGGGKIMFEVTNNINNSTTGIIVTYADDSNQAFLKQYPLIIGLRGNSGYNLLPYNKNFVNDLQWHHYTCIFDKSQVANNECSLYLDGDLKTPSFYPSGLVSNNSNNFGNNPLFLGSRSGTSIFSNIELANFLIYNRVLTASEALQNYNALKGRFGL
jgi:hypothetical protein